MTRNPLPARIAIVLGYLLGTWMFVDGVHCWITGDYLRVQGQLGPWAELVQAAGLRPQGLAWLIVLYGVLWLVAGNLYLFRRSAASWRGLLGLSVATLWYLGFATPLLVVLIGLLLAPASRRGLNA